MKKVDITSDTVQHLELSYSLDDEFIPNNTLTKSKEGVVISINDALSSCNDTSVNNYSNFILTNKIPYETLGYIKTNKTSIYPQKFSTYLGIEDPVGGIIATGFNNTSKFIGFESDRSSNDITPFT